VFGIGQHGADGNASASDDDAGADSASRHPRVRALGQLWKANAFARLKIASSIEPVTRPVNVFCWLGW
jgi:hypothetical protein